MVLSGEITAPANVTGYSTCYQVSHPSTSPLPPPPPLPLIISSRFLLIASGFSFLALLVYLLLCLFVVCLLFSHKYIYNFFLHFFLVRLMLISNSHFKRTTLESIRRATQPKNWQLITTFWRESRSKSENALVCVKVGLPRVLASMGM